MKSATFVSCVALLLFLASPWIVAQPDGQAPKLTVDVPFDFMIGRAMFPAGHYIVKRAGSRTFRLQATRGRTSLKFVTLPMSIASPSGATRLVFLPENRHYQLRELWLNSDTGARIPGPQVEQLRTAGESSIEVPAICTGCN